MHVFTTLFPCFVLPWHYEQGSGFFNHTAVLDVHAKFPPKAAFSPLPLRYLSDSDCLFEV